MPRRYLWSAVVFAAVPVLVFACGGRTDIDLLLDASAGAGGAAGHGGAGHGGAGVAGTTAGTGTAGSPVAGAGGNGLLCSPGQQESCACPGTDLQGVQVCNSSGQGYSSCTGCPTVTPAGGGGQNAGGGLNVGGSSAGTGTAGTGTAGAGNTAGTGTAGKAGEAPDGGGDFFDALPFPLPDSGPVGECVACLQDKCDSAINGCYNSADCTAGIQCALTTCAGGGGNPLGGGGSGGGLDFGCLLGCFNGNINAVFSAVQAFQCITQTCGSNCGGDILGDGGFPLGGLGGGNTPLGALGGGQMPATLTMQGVRVPGPSEVPGYPRMQQALTPAKR